MSAFAGLLYLDGRPCSPPVVEAMLARLRHRVDARGIAATRVRCQGSMGLGSMPLVSTPQALWEIAHPDEAQTLNHNGLSLWLSGDIRVDNRDELVRELRLDSEAGRLWSDGRLVLEAYAHWGEATHARLRGDFAFAIWDQCRHQLFCARDRFGTRPFYYAYVPGHFFAFASEIKALWCVPGTDASVNDTQIANYLLGRFEDKRTTFYKSIQRLPPATSLTLTPDFKGPLIENIYWQLDAGREITLGSDKEYAALLREEFTASVKERMRSEGRFSVFLSGGLDSSSVTAVAEREAGPTQKPVPTLSRVFDRFPQCDEREYIFQTLDRGEFEPIWMVGDDITSLTNIEKVVQSLDQPSPGPNMCAAWAQYGVLQEKGFHVVLDGHGGDEVVFTGYERVGELLKRGEFITAGRELRYLHQRGVRPTSGPTLLGTPIEPIWSALLWHASGKPGLGRLMAMWKKQTQTRQSGQNRISKSNSADARALSVLSPELATCVETSHQEPSRTVKGAHYEAVSNALQPLALEILDAMAGAHTMESRCPFWEQNIVETCLAFPGEQKLRHGFNRYVMRQAMQDVLAPSVQWRPSKTNFASQSIETLRDSEHKYVDSLIDRWEAVPNALQGYIDLNEVRSLWNDTQAGASDSHQAALAAFILWRVLCVATWLDQQEPRLML